MHEILFRGKRIDSGEWAEGYYVPMGEYHYILTGRLELVPYLDFEHFLVNPETVGQFTGLTDRNGVKIFEGDIIEFNHPYNGKSMHAVVQDGCGWNLSNFYASCFDCPGCAFSEGTEYMTVLGNIYDNPELFDEGET